MSGWWVYCWIHYSRPISQIPQWHQSNIPQCTISQHKCAHFFYKMLHCGCVHIAVAKCCIVGYDTDALWDLWDRSVAWSFHIGLVHSKVSITIFYITQHQFLSLEPVIQIPRPATSDRLDIWPQPIYKLLCEKLAPRDIVVPNYQRNYM